MNKNKHLITVHSSISDDVKEFYIDDKTLDYLKKNVFKTPEPEKLPEIINLVEYDAIYIRHVKQEIIKLELEKEKLKTKIKKDYNKYSGFKVKYFAVITSMKKYSKIEKYSNFIDLPQEEVDALINYRKAWILFKERRKFLLGEIKLAKDRITIIDAELNKYTNFLKGINS